MANNVDPAFRSVPKTSAFFTIWRIENFKPVQVPKDQQGSFYDGDAYIVFNAKETRGALQQDLHFWLGSECSQDEKGTAAIKAVELDDYLGGAPIQHRECQGHESKVFLGYFKNRGGVRYQKGGVASGFNHVEHKIQKRLLSVKGKHVPKMEEKSEIAWSEMNKGDAFILDLGEILYVWNGESCSRTERIKALELARKLRDDRGHANIVVIEDGEENPDDMGDEEFNLFDEHLPVSEKGDLKSATEGGADDAYEKKKSAQLKLWKVAEEDGSLKVTEVSTAPLDKKMLDSGDCFIVDNGEDGIYVWTGKKASSVERKESMANALAFLDQRDYSSLTKVTKVPDGGEPSEFKALFKTWEKPRLPGSNKPYSQNKIARTVQTKFDALTLHENPKVAMETGMVDDGAGAKKIWRIENFDKVELERKHFGKLYGGDCYIILYTYLSGGAEQFIIYYWLGRNSTADERGVAAKKTIEIDDSLGGAAKQVRVVHGKEPNHFMAMFGGKLMIFQGGKAGWGGQNSTDTPGDKYLLHIRGTSQYNTKAEQVDCTAESLNSNDVFVLYSKSQIYVWAGKGCTGDEREMAKQVASIAPRGYQLVTEGQEKEDFWELLGGKADYASDFSLKDPENEDRPPRLFQCSNASGRFISEEIVDFVQVDLVTEDVFLLDAHSSLYLWIGKESRDEEKTLACDMALEYLESDPSGRDLDTPIFMVKQSYEPPDFIGHFGVWDRDLWGSGKTYAELKSEMGEKNVAMDQIKQKSSKQNGETSFSDVAKIPYSVLIQPRAELPEGVDVQNKEKHLSDEEFEKLFGMPYATFVTKPVWKQTQLKKEHKLF